MMLLEFSISPLGKGESVAEYVAKAVDIVDKSGVAYRLNPMGTVIEGDWDQCFGVVKKCFDALAKDSKRISISIKVDWREGKESRIESKVSSVEKILGRKLKR